MSSVNSVSAGISDLFQALSSTGSSAVGSVLTQGNLQSKLEGASSSDIVKLSEQALQLQQTDGIFGAGASSTAASSPSAVSPESLLLQAVQSSQPQSVSVTG